MGFSCFYSPKGAAGIWSFPRNIWEPWAWTPWRITLTFGGNFEHQPFALWLCSTFPRELMLRTLHVVKELFMLELIPAQQGPGITLGGGHIPPWEPSSDEFSVGQDKHQPWGYFPISFLSSGLECPTGRATGGSKANTSGFYWHLSQQRSQNFKTGKRNFHFSGR